MINRSYSYCYYYYASYPAREAESGIGCKRVII
ncbi:MAG: hypothetical protein JWN60_2339 [Acidobacteria bacterium]|jgi:hypothetical protein|nr:hypothetical protein [Acidobacteriota bacterium]